MVKRSRHHCPLLSPLSLSRHFIRACQIRLMASFKPKNVTPRHSSHTLTSSKVKSASKSDKRDILSVGGPDRNVVEAKMSIDRASGPSPPPLPPTLPAIPGLMREPDEVKCLGLDRLRYLVDLHSPCTLEQSKKYLELFYHDIPRRPVATSVADAACQCLEKECNMRFWWKNKEAVFCIPEYSLSQSITDCMFPKAVGQDESLPFGVDAALCIAKEAEFIIEWLRRRGPFLTSEEHVLCHKIRWIAYKLFGFKGNCSTYISAALVAIRREAEVLIENLRVGSDKSISTSMKIRRFAFDFIILEMSNEYGLNLSEMESEFSGMASEVNSWNKTVSVYHDRMEDETKRVCAKKSGPGHSKNCDLQQKNDGLESAANLCLEKMNTMKFWTGVYVAGHGQFLDTDVIRTMFFVMEGKKEVHNHPFAVDAALCLAKEAELIVELLKKKRGKAPRREDMLSYKIRIVAFELFSYPGKWFSTHVVAALVGIRKEAERRIENLKLGSDSRESITTYLNNRQSDLDFLEKTVDDDSVMLQSDDSDDSIDAVSFW